MWRKQTRAHSRLNPFCYNEPSKLYKYYTTNNTGQISWTSEYKTNLVPRVPRAFPGKGPGDQVGGKLGVTPPPPPAQHGNLGFEAVSKNFKKVGLARPLSYNYKKNRSWYLPTHVVPFPEYPDTQLQLNDPTVLLQKALKSQLSVWFIHSSTSKMR